MAQINNRAIQDMHIFGDPMRVPIVITERVWNAPRRTFSENSYMRHVDRIDSSLLSGHDDESGTRKHNNSQHSGRELKIVVFVHGFQASSEKLNEFLLRSFCLLALCPYVQIAFCFTLAITVLLLYHFKLLYYLHDRYLLTSTVGASLRPKAYPEPVAPD